MLITIVRKRKTKFEGVPDDAEYFLYYKKTHGIAGIYQYLFHFHFWMTLSPRLTGYKCTFADI